jgi:HSP20 family protein
MSTLTLWGLGPRPRPVLARRAFVDFDTAFDQLVRRTFGTSTPSDQGKPFVPAAEIVRDGEDALVRLELPGVDAGKDITVEVDDGRLLIKGERRDERSSESDGRSLREVRYGSFSRSFTLPEGVTGDAVSASYDAGVLNVRVAGAYAEAAIPAAHRVEITTGTPAAVESDASQTPVQAVEADAQS